MGEAGQLGTLEAVDVRQAWRHEAQDFTPWLAANLDRLASVLGVELECEDTEVRVGPYRADIVARIPQDDSRVLIENQLGDADLRHLGQLLAYLAGLEAKMVIWVATGFDEAHRSAIRWLNEHTADPFATSLREALSDDHITTHCLTERLIDSRDRSNWDEMADWLDTRRRTYERVLTRSIE